MSAGKGPGRQKREAGLQEVHACHYAKGRGKMVQSRKSVKRAWLVRAAPWMLQLRQQRRHATGLLNCTERGRSAVLRSTTKPDLADFAQLFIPHRRRGRQT